MGRQRYGAKPSRYLVDVGRQITILKMPGELTQQSHDVERRRGSTTQYTGTCNTLEADSQPLRKITSFRNDLCRT